MYAEKLDLTPSDRFRIARATLRHTHRKHWWNNCGRWEIFPTFCSRYWVDDDDDVDDDDEGGGGGG